MPNNQFGKSYTFTAALGARIPVVTVRPTRKANGYTAKTNPDFSSEWALVRYLDNGGMGHVHRSSLSEAA